MKKLLVKSFAIIMSILTILPYAGVFANQASMDNRFDTKMPVGFDSTVYAVTIQDDGKIIAGGKFTTYEGIQTNKLARINADGTKDPSFDIGSGFNGDVRAVLLLDNGKIVVGGDFTSYNGTDSSRIIRLNADGSVDTSFDIWSGFNNADNGSDPAYVATLALSASGKILVGGNFQYYGPMIGVCTTDAQYLDQTTCESNEQVWWLQQTVAGYIISLNDDGTRDTDFDMVAWFEAIVRDIAVWNDGKIAVAGDFSTYYGSGFEEWVTAAGIVLLNADGTKDIAFDFVDWLAWWINTIAIQGNGKIVVGGATNFLFSRLYRFNTDGTLDDSFHSPSSSMWMNIYSLVVQDDGKIVVGGNWATLDSLAPPSPVHIMRLNADGSLDLRFPWFVSRGSSDGAYAITIQDDGKIVVGGNFNSYNWIWARGIIRFTTDGEKDTTFYNGDGINTDVNTVAVQDDGKVLVWGKFVSYGWVSANRLTRLNTDGSMDTWFDVGDGFNNDISVVAIQDNGKILVGGKFSQYNWESVKPLIRLNTDGTRDTSFVVGEELVGEITDVAIQADGKIVAVGVFYWNNPENFTSIIRLNTDGTKDISFDAGDGFGITEQVYTVALQEDGKILVGGLFDNYQGTTTNNIVRITTGGSIDTDFDMGVWADSMVNNIAIQEDWKILVGGNFSHYDGFLTYGLVRLNSDGTPDTDFVVWWVWKKWIVGWIYYVKTILPQADGKILVGGDFTSRVEDTPTTALHGMIRLTSIWDVDTAFDVGDGFNGVISSMALSNSGRIFVGGNFSRYNWVAAWYLTALYGESDVVILPNSNDTGTMISAFTGKWYIKPNGDLVWDMPISLRETDGDIPAALHLKNQNIKLVVSAGSQFTQIDGVTNYNGIISVPFTKSFLSVNDEPIISSFKVGGGSESLRLTWGVALLSTPTADGEIWDFVHVFYSEDNWVTRLAQATGVITSFSGQKYVSFNTQHFSDFAITLPNGGGSFTGSFVINADAASTTSNAVVLTMSTIPTAAHMRFSNDNIMRSNRETYTTTKNWTLSSDYGSKTVYVQFDAAGTDPDIADMTLSDTISYVAATNGSNGWGGWSSPAKDQCPAQRDCSDSYYDNLCGKCSLIEKIAEKITFNKAADKSVASIANSSFSTELNNAYLRAYGYDITTMPTIQQANINGTLLRKDMAKMISNFAINVLHKDVSTGAACTFTDTRDLSKETQYYIIAACRLGLMGYESDGIILKQTFVPNDEVDRGQFGTILSRLLRGEKNNGWTTYYEGHLNALKTEWIMTKIDQPNSKELRGRVMLMMQRIFNKK